MPKIGLDALLRPEDSILVLIDHQPFQFANLHSHEPTMVVNNVIGLAKSAKVFNVPTILTTVVEERGGYPIKGLQDVFPEQKPINRTFINTRQDERVVEIVKNSGRKQLVLAALWTEICLAMPTIQALAEGYDAFIVTDAFAGVSVEAHDMAVRRMVAAGAVPITWLAVASEWQRDWAREKSAIDLARVVAEHGGGSWSWPMARSASIRKLGTAAIAAKLGAAGNWLVCYAQNCASGVRDSEASPYNARWSGVWETADIAVAWSVRQHCPDLWVGTWVDCRWAATDAAAYEGRRLRQGLLDKTNTAGGVWADTAYRSAANETFLNKNGFVSHIHRKKPKGRAMPETMRRANNAKSKIRSRVEHVFAEQKSRMGLFITTIGIARATTKIGMANLVYNIKRFVFLRKIAFA